MSPAPETAFQALLGVAESTLESTPVLLTGLRVLDWGRALVLTGTVGDAAFELRYDDCRELRWRVYVAESAAATPLVSFAPGRDQQRSPAQLLTAHFGLSLYYGSFTIIKP